MMGGGLGTVATDMSNTLAIQELNTNTEKMQFIITISDGLASCSRCKSLILQRFSV